MSSLFTIDSLSINGTVLGGIVDQAFSPNVEAVLAGNAGSQVPTFGAVMGYRPVGRFSTVHVATALGLVGVGGLAIDANNVLMTFRQRDVLAVKGSTDHTRVTFDDGIIVPRTISASQGQPATIQYEILARGDASNAPVTIASNASSSAAQETTEVFTLGPVKFNGTMYVVQGWTLNFNWREIVRGSDGLAWPTFVGLGDQEPELTVQSHEMGRLATVVPGGLDITACIAFLRKVAEGGTRVAVATEEHISFTINEGVAFPGEASGSQGDDGAQVDLTVRPTHDGTNAIVVVDTTAAIA